MINENRNVKVTLGGCKSDAPKSWAKIITKWLVQLLLLQLV